ncbi:MAG: DUF4252 domain-containing protein [Dysgonomonas sp.]|nr:DUF4252 domain-containing protein [Dysgonomonas sp.]
MKKYILSIALVIASTSFAFGQNVDQLLKKASKIENVEKVQIGGFLMGLGKMFGGVNNMPVAKGVKSMEILDLSSCDGGTKQNLIKDFKKTRDGNGYETLMMVREKNDGIRIMVKKEKKYISEIVFLCMDNNDPAIIKFSGKISEEDINKLVDQYN